MRAGATARVRGVKLVIDIVSIREYRMEWARDIRRTVRTAAALVVAGAALVTGGVLATTSTKGPVVSPGSTTVLVALPDRVGAANRAW